MGLAGATTGDLQVATQGLVPGGEVELVGVDGSSDGAQHRAMTFNGRTAGSRWSLLTLVGGVLVAVTGVSLLALFLLWGRETSALRFVLAAGQVACGVLITVGAIRRRRGSRE